MTIRRRDFVAMLGAAPAALLPGAAGAATRAETAPGMAAGVDPAVEKSIRASFGGGFSVRTQTELRGLTYAEIEHSGNRFVVASADALDWKFVASDRTL